MLESDDDVFCFNLDKFTDFDISEDEFFDKGLDFDGSFDNPKEFKEFCISLGSAYPDGITLRYFSEKINFYRTSKVISSLLGKGLVQESEDEDGNLVYSLTDFGRSSVQTGDFDF